MKSLIKLLGIEYPVLQGAMAHISRYELVSAVSNAGGLGIIASGGMPADELRNQIRTCKKLTNKPFGVNLMLMMDNIDELVDVILDEKVGIVTTGAGTPKPFMQKLKSANVIVIPVIPSVKIAKKMEELGVDALVVEGTEAGGHVGESTTMTLLPQVADAVSIPVIAAGGIADSRGVIAAYALGASGVQVGTAFLVAKECPISSEFKQAIINADDNATTVTGRMSGAPIRCIKNMMTAKYIELEFQRMSRVELEHLTQGSLLKAVIDGDVENGSVMAGQIAGLIKECKSTKQIITDLFVGIDAVLQRVDGVLSANKSNIK